MRLAGESVTRGSTCAAMRVGKFSSAESFTALWRKEAQEVTDLARELHLLEAVESVDMVDPVT